MDTSPLQDALTLFELPETVTLAAVNERYRKLLYTWHPNRYASLTNNPRKYMEMYKKGENKTKEIHSAYHVLLEWLRSTQPPA
ncbi:J domain-containing protein [Nitrospira sp. M1]